MRTTNTRYQRMLTMWLLLAVPLLVAASPAVAGEYHDLGRPIIGAWQRFAWVVHDPQLGKDVLWSQECSQDGAVLYALDIETGDVIEQHSVPAREVGGIVADADGVLYIYTYSGLTHPGNELLRFHPERRKIERLGLAETPRNRCISGAIGPDGNVYIGTHQQGRLFRYNTPSDTWEDLGQQVPEPIRERQNIWLDNLQFTPSGKLLASVVRQPPVEVVEIDIRSGAFNKVDTISSRNFRLFGNRILVPTEKGVAVHDANYARLSELTIETLAMDERYDTQTPLVMRVADAKAGLLCEVGDVLVRVNPTTKELATIAPLPFQASTLCVTTDGASAIAINHPIGQFAVLDLASGEVVTRTIGYQGQRGTQICGLNRASDGSVYGTNIIGMHLFHCNSETDELSDLGHVGWSGGEVYGVIEADDKVYFGTYGGGHWGVYDPTQPWDPDFAGAGTAAEANPRRIARLGGDEPDAANRPFEYVRGPNGKVYIACRANYGHPGGSLVEFDPETNETHVFRDTLRSVQSVTADDRFIYGGTNIHGGRGSGDRAEHGTLFVFDPEIGKRVFEAAAEPAIAVVCVRYNPRDKLVYATTSNQVLLAFNPRTFEIENQWNLRSPGTPLAGVPEDVGMLHITAATDGNIYGIGYRDLYRLVTATGKLEYLETPPLPGLYQIVEGKPGVFYMGAGTHLLKYLAEPSQYFR